MGCFEMPAFAKGTMGVCEAVAKVKAAGGTSIIGGYIGKSDAVPEAFVQFAGRYADQTEADHAAMVQAVKDGRLPEPEGE